MTLNKTYHSNENINRFYHRFDLYQPNEIFKNKNLINIYFTNSLSHYTYPMTIYHSV